MLINTCNHGPFLNSCLESVFNQTQPPDEIIVYDDDSTDGSRELLRAHQDRVVLIAGTKDPRRTHQECQAHAIEQAFLRSSGELIFLLDGDDAFRPRKIARYHRAFRENPRAVLIQSPVQKIDDQGRIAPYVPEPFRQVAEPLAAAYARHDLDLFYPTSALAFSREFLSQALPLSWADRLDLWGDVRLTTAALLAGAIINLTEPLTLWRRHARSLSLREEHSRGRLVRLTWQRARLFNRLARAAGSPRVSVWRNRRFFLQLARLLLPWPGDAAARWSAEKTSRDTGAPARQ